MSTEQFLSRLERNGVNLYLEGESLRCKAPPGILDNDDKLAMKDQKEALIKLLQDRQKVSTSLVETVMSVISTDPDKVALTTVQGEISYGQLGNMIAACRQQFLSIDNLGQCVIAVHTARCDRLIAATLAALSCGASLMVIPVTAPEVFKQRQVAQLQISTLFSDEPLAWRESTLFVEPDGTALSMDGQACEPNGGLIAYCGMEPLRLTESLIFSRLQWLQHLFLVDPQSVIRIGHAIGHPMFLTEALLAVMAGASAVEESWEGVTHCFVTTSELSTVPDSDTLAYVLCGGEPLPLNTAATFSGSHKAELHSLLFIPEAGGFIASVDARRKSGKRMLTAGYAAPGIDLQLLDTVGRPVPTGVQGELAISGAVTEQITHPLLNEKGAILPENQQQVIRTGFAGQQYDDGQIEPDWPDCVSVRHAGYNLPLDVIEELILQHQSVLDCALVQQQSVAGDYSLCAFVVIQEKVEKEAITEFLKGVLPIDWVPDYIIPVNSIPLTRDGRLDTRQLATHVVADDQSVEKLCQTVVERVAGIDCVAFREPVTAEKELVYIEDVILPAAKSQESDGVSGATETDDAVSDKPAIADGGELAEMDAGISTMQDILQRAVDQEPGHGVHFYETDGSDQFISYPELAAAAEKILHGMREAGLKPQDKVLFQFERNTDFILAFWGCQLGGFVPVPIAASIDYDHMNPQVSKLVHAYRMMDRAIVLTSDKLIEKIKGVKELAGLDEFPVFSIDTMKSCPADTSYHPLETDDMALLMLTSGSTGAPKGVMLRHRNLLARSAGSRQMNGFSRDSVSLNWMALDHVGGIIYFHIRDVFLGSQQVHVTSDVILRKPLMWLDLIEKHRASISWAPNFAFALINDLETEIGQGSWDLSSMLYLLNGGEAVVPKTARRFVRILNQHGLPETALRPVFGMSEISSGVTYTDGHTLQQVSDDAQFVSVGQPIPGVLFRAVDEHDQLLKEGQIGQLQVLGKTVMAGYFNDPEKTAEAFTGDGWFRTGDLGFVRDNEVTITGREKDVIIINGVNYYSHEIEAVIEELEGIEVSYTGACAVREPDTVTDKLVIFYHPVSAQGAELVKLNRQIREQVMKKIGVTVSHILPVPREEIPKTEIGKIQRSKLSKLFQEGHFISVQRELDRHSASASGLENWFYQVVWQRRQMRIAQPDVSVPGTVTLLLAQEDELAQTIMSQQSSILVVKGSGFHASDDQKLTLDPTCADSCQQLLEWLQKKNLCVGQLISLWDYCSEGFEPLTASENDAGSHRAIAGHLGLLQALLKAQGDNMQLTYVADSLYACHEKEVLLPAKSAMSGLFLTLAQEQPGFRIRLIDLPAKAEKRDIDLLLGEIRVQSVDQEVAIRDGQRWIKRLRQINWKGQERRVSRLRQNGCYIVSGGLGGIGAQLLPALVTNHQLRIAMVEKLPFNELPSERQQLFETLQQKSSGIIYVQADVTDFSALEQAISPAADELGVTQWDGVIHLAGLAKESLLVNETVDTIRENGCVKIQGAVNLYKLIESNKQADFIAFSSVNGFFGGATVGAYAYANAFVDGFCAWLREKGVNATALAWTMWNGVGMSAFYDETVKGLSRQRGFIPLDATQAVMSFDMALQVSGAYLLTGLDGSRPFLSRMVTDECRNAEKLLLAIGTHGQDVPLRQLQDITVSDPFGHKLSFEIVEYEELPVNADGSVDIRQLQLLNQDKASTRGGHVEPSSETEIKIAEVWKQVLNLGQVGADETFFEIGGNSLMLVQVHTLIKEALQVDIEVTVLFQYPTIAALAEYITDNLISQEPAKPSVQMNQAKNRAEKRARAAAGRGAARQRRTTKEN